MNGWMVGSMDDWMDGWCVQKILYIGKLKLLLLLISNSFPLIISTHDG